MLLLGQYRLIFPEMSKFMSLATVWYVLIWVYALALLWTNLEATINWILNHLPQQLQTSILTENFGRTQVTV